MQGRIKASKDLGAVPKMRATTPTGLFYYAYCLMMHMLVNLFVGQIAIKIPMSLAVAV